MIQDHVRASVEPTLDTNLEVIPYTNPRVGSLVTNLKAALDYLFASLMPNYIGTYNTPADLPASADDNSYAYVVDDGDGKSSGYVWSTLDGVSGWQKRYDVDWSVDSLLSSFLSETHPLYVLLNGRENGQTIYGGIATGENLEFNANSVDDTGKVITHNHFEPKVDNTIDLGEVAKRFKDIFLNGALKDGTITLTMANLKDAFDHISLTNNPHDTSYDQLTNKLGTITLDGDVSGSADLSASGNKTLTVTVANDSHSHSKTTLPGFDTDVYTKVKSILQSADGISFAANDGAETLTPSQADINTTEITDIDSPTANKVLASNATGDSWIATTFNVELGGDLLGNANFNSTTGKVAITATVENVDMYNIDGVDLHSEQVTLTAGATTTVTHSSHGLKTGNKIHIDSSVVNVVVPQLVGEYVITKIDDNTYTIPVTTSVGGGASVIGENSQLLYDTTSQTFKVKRPFAGLVHSDISNPDANDDHQQYVRVSGRIGSQVIQGGQDNNENLVLESTASAIKGVVSTKDNFVPFTNASYSGSWSGIDLGSSSYKFRHLNIAGELKGARLENLTANPSASGQSIGRIFYNTTEDKIYYDNGTSIRPLSSANITTIIVSMSSETTKLVDLTSVLDVGKTTSDYAWVLYDSTTSQPYHPSIARTTSSSVTINSELPLTGTFLLKGI